MPKPQEKRFWHIALAQKVLTKDQINACLQYQASKRDEGSTIPLWDCAVLQNMLDQAVAEKLQREAGELDVERLGEFAILRKLGEGGMGTVWLAVGPEKQRVAIKLLPPHLARQRTFLTRFFREAQACMKLEHDNIVRGVEVAEDHGRYYFAMEFVAGRSCKELVNKNGFIPHVKATEIILQITEGLACAHDHGMVHRDIKPDNIMVTRDGVAKLMDLGLVHQSDAEMTALTRTGQAMGTPYYMAPEQASDAKRADARSDIYSLGATWYHMVTGRVPFEGDGPLQILQKHMKEPVKPPHLLRSEIPRGISLAIERMMSKDPDNRFQSAGEVHQFIQTKCMGDRDVAKELGLAGRDPLAGLWDVMISVGGKREKRRMSVDEIRVRVKRGQITGSTPTRRAGSHEGYQPAKDFLELEKEFFRDYAVRTKSGSADESSTRRRMRELVTNYDKVERAHRRKKAWKKIKRNLVSLGVLAAIAVAVWLLWPTIRDALAGASGSAGGTQDAAVANAD